MGSGRTPDANGFVECATCDAQPGMPVLCNACLSNRTTISQLTKQVDSYERNNLRMSADAASEIARLNEPIPMRLRCPDCHELHVDTVFATKRHHTHACQHCGAVWRPAVVATVGVRFLPGFKDDVPSG